jgi:hypothetical protein
MRVLHFGQLEELFPIRPFLLQRRRTITHLNPANFLSGSRLASCMFLRYSPSATEPFPTALNRRQQLLLIPGLNALSH